MAQSNKTHWSTTRRIHILRLRQPPATQRKAPETEKIPDPDGEFAMLREAMRHIGSHALDDLLAEAGRHSGFTQADRGAFDHLDTTTTDRLGLFNEEPGLFFLEQRDSLGGDGDHASSSCCKASRENINRFGDRAIVESHPDIP